jgi:hypothetical protein
MAARSFASWASSRLIFTLRVVKALAMCDILPILQHKSEFGSAVESSLLDEVRQGLMVEKTDVL